MRAGDGGGLSAAAKPRRLGAQEKAPLRDDAVARLEPFHDLDQIATDVPGFHRTLEKLAFLAARDIDDRTRTERLQRGTRYDDSRRTRARRDRDLHEHAEAQRSIRVRH